MLFFRPVENQSVQGKIQAINNATNNCLSIKYENGKQMELSRKKNLWIHLPISESSLLMTTNFA
ncbi:hypothetical protein SAMN05661012_04286 [Chitinophaga sancti]|uniref:Uncharacterized protein n=1 Tax=Chitinophaga sancti TaxID=1004 RepID=A0A1K1RUL2_9BACT|nr:hypothetical protein SAMN05661012_04286 [Chitinophaga sancti]